MKKILLSASLLMLTSAAFAAAVEDVPYSDVNGLKMENLYSFSRQYDLAAFEASTLNNSSSPSAVTDGKTVYVGVCGAQATIEKYDLMTGAYIGALPLTLNGEAFAGTLSVASIGFDEYGNFYAATYIDSSDGVTNYCVYTVDLETGAVESVGDLFLDGCAGRIDFCDVIGDITGEQAAGRVMACNGAEGCNVFNWVREQGTDEWVGGWDDGSIVRQTTGMYPENIAFNNGSVVKISRVGSDKSGALQYFWVDANYGYPTLYGSNGNAIDNMAEVDWQRTNAETGETTGTIPEPSQSADGIAEGTVGGQNLIAFVNCQPNDGAQGSLFQVGTVDENWMCSSLGHLWLSNALGATSDGGRRIHCLQFVEESENTILLMSYKCYNGLALYRITNTNAGGVEENTVAAAANITVNGDVIAVSETAETIEVYNVAGQKVAQVENTTEVAAPATGLYIVKAVVDGAPVVKKVIVK